MADGDVVKSFLVDIGFAPDPASASAAEALVRKTEGRITDVTEAESDKRAAVEQKSQAQLTSRLDRWLASRTAAEKKANDEKVDAVAKMFGQIMGLDEAQAKELVKRAKTSAAQSVDIEKEKTKKSQVIRSEQFKDLEVGLLRFTGLAEKISLGIGGLLAGAPFGAFLMGVERTAAGLSNLAIQSQRVGSSATGIQRFLFAMKRQGVDEGEATGALEGFSSKMKTNPQGYRQALERMGVRTTGQDGKPLGYDEMLENFGGNLASLPYNQAKIQAGQFGVTGDNALNALRDPAETRKGLGLYDEKLKGFGLDPDKAAGDARKVQQAYDNLEADLKIIHTKLDAEFFVPMMNGFDALAKKLEGNPQAIENYGRALEAFSALAAARILPTIANLLVKFTGLQAVIGGGLGTALGVALNPVVVAGASAESTPTAPVTTDPAGRARKLANNTLPAGEMTAEEREAFSKKHGGGLWDWVKSKLGIGGAAGAEDAQVKSAIIGTEKAVKDLKDVVERQQGGLDGASDAAGGGGGGGGILARARRTLGFAATASGDHTHVSSSGKVGDLSKNPYATKENADAIKSAAKELGTTPEDLATVIGYETGGTFSPSKIGGAGNRYQGLIQFGPSERAQYGANGNQTFVEQMEAVKRYLKGRGFKPGMGLLDLYSTINAGSPGHYGASDGNGTVSSHVTRMQGSTAALARAFLARGTPDATPVPSSAGPVGDQAALDAQNRIIAGKGRPGDRGLIDRHRQEQNTPALPDRNPDGSLTLANRTLGRYIHTTAPMFARGEIGHARKQHPGEVAKVEVVKSNLDAAHQKLAEAMRRAGGDPQKLMPVLRHPLGITPAIAAAINASRHSHVERHGDTFNIHGTDAKSGLDHAVKVSARREGQDRIRYGQGSVQ